MKNIENSLSSFLTWKEFCTIIHTDKPLELFKKSDIRIKYGEQLHLEILFSDYSTKSGFVWLNKYSDSDSLYIELQWSENSINVTKDSPPNEMRFGVHPNKILGAQIRELWNCYP